MATDKKPSSSPSNKKPDTGVETPTVLGTLNEQPTVQRTPAIHTLEDGTIRTDY